MELKRDIYQDLLRWKESHSGHVLELRGARQVGKTFILNKFAKENYRDYFYINMTETTGHQFLECLHKAAEWEPGMPREEQPIHRAFSLYDVSFQDKEDTVVVIDEIQESAEVFSMIRQFARNFSCHFIVTGSYLGKTRDHRYFQSVGDLDILTLYTLNFAEFLDAFGKRELYESVDLYGESSHEIYDELKGYYDIYCEIGGYPAVVMEYLENHSLENCQRELARIIRIFTEESENYFDDVRDMNLFERVLPVIAQTMMQEKKGSKDLISDLSNIIYKEESGKVTRQNIARVIAWLYRSHIIGYCGRMNGCNPKDISMDVRFYFLDVGLCRYFLSKAYAGDSEARGLVNENFVYIDLLKRIEANQIGGACPVFGTYKDGEIDFLIFNQKTSNLYGVEVKVGRGTGRTAQQLLKDKKVKAVYFLKGDTYGGIEENMLTVPIYLADRVCYEVRCLP